MLFSASVPGDGFGTGSYQAVRQYCMAVFDPADIATQQASFLFIPSAGSLIALHQSLRGLPSVASRYLPRERAEATWNPWAFCRNTRLREP